MRKPRPKKSSPRSGVQAFVVFVLVTGLVVGAMWVSQRREPPSTPPTPAYSEPGWLPENKSDRWKCIVIHHSADEHGNAEKYDYIHRTRPKDPFDELGYHFVIGNGSLSSDGQVEIGPRWVKQKHGAHCKTDNHFYNEHGIGICLVGNFNNHPPDAQQMKSLARLVRFLCIEFKIPTSAIYTHGGVTGKTECPGSQFDLEKLKGMIGKNDE